MLEIGQIVRKHGYRGYCKLQTDVNLEPVQNDLHWLFLFFSDKPVPFSLQTCQVPSPGMVLIKLEGIEDEQQLRPLLDRAAGIHRRWAGRLSFEITELERLIGYEVIDDRSGKSLGRLEAIDQRAVQPLATINTGSRSWLFPLPDELIVDIQHEHQRLRVVTPEGLERL